MKDKLNKSSILNTQNLNSSNILSLSDNKKVTIRDLCPEEKAKIGDLLRKLADENQEKERLKQIMEEDKKNYENKIDTILKEKEYLNTSHFNTSINLKNESFIGDLIPQNCEKVEIINKDSNSKENLKLLREKFDKLHESLKKTAKNQEEYLSRYSNSNTTTLENQNNTSISILREEKPLILDCKPIPKENDILLSNSMIFSKDFDNLQTSILNINEEIKESINQNILSDSKYFNYF